MGFSHFYTPCQQRHFCLLLDCLFKNICITKSLERYSLVSPCRAKVDLFVVQDNKDVVSLWGKDRAEFLKVIS